LLQLNTIKISSKSDVSMETTKNINFRKLQIGLTWSEEWSEQMCKFWLIYKERFLRYLTGRKDGRTDGRDDCYIPPLTS
jgi:hypothetical protein